jgi:hypothetical protein
MCINTIRHIHRPLKWVTEPTLGNTRVHGSNHFTHKNRTADLLPPSRATRCRYEGAEIRKIDSVSFIFKLSTFKVRKNTLEAQGLVREMIAKVRSFLKRHAGVIA